MGSSSGQHIQAAVAPFVVKTYTMVSDPSTEAIIQWGRGNNSFIVLDPALFSQILLPIYFNHTNFSSFVRQLNTYGFKKVDPDRWEFAHQSFLRGQIHVLPLIVRRRKSDDSRKRVDQTMATEDDEILLPEVRQLRIEQRALEDELQDLSKRIQAMERRPQQVISFLFKLADNPDFLPSRITSKMPQPVVDNPLMSANVAATTGYIDDIPASSDVSVEHREMKLQVPESSSSMEFPFSLLGQGFF